jgi:3-deoxy-alpha-D-manno-octulosonate 8-oxidase
VSGSTGNYSIKADNNSVLDAPGDYSTAIGYTTLATGLASYAGGMSIAYSQVGVAHAVSYGLSYLLGTKHGIGNCIVMNHLEEYYPAGVKEFKYMVDKNNIDIPTGICADLTEEQFDAMINVSLGMKPLWENALGKDWEKIMTREKLRTVYGKL